MALFLRVAIVALIGVAAGLLMTWMAVERGHGFGAVRAGPWTGWPKAGTAAADPYARAVMSRTGEVPLGLAEGLTFIARTDSRGATLKSTCDYIVSSPIPVARYWSLTLVTRNGLAPSAAAGRHGLTSSEIIRNGKGSFEIMVSSTVKPGNWLPATIKGSYVLVLRLYDTPMSAAASALTEAELPKIKPESCA